MIYNVQCTILYDTVWHLNSHAVPSYNWYAICHLFVGVYTRYNEENPRAPCSSLENYNVCSDFWWLVSVKRRWQNVEGNDSNAAKLSVLNGYEELEIIPFSC